VKLAHKIILANVLTMIFIALVYAFSYQKFGLLLDKLKFVEIADSLNATLLQMRISEKNYFLYKDNSDLPLIRMDLINSSQAINEAKQDIIRAIGEKNFNRLQSSLKQYEQQVAKLESSDESYSKDLEVPLREAGRQLREHSASIVRIERETVNKMIAGSRRALFFFFGIVLIVAIYANYLFFAKMFRSLRKIEKTANAISAGNFNKIDEKLSNDELGTVMKAINSMCEELGTRHELLIQSRKLVSLGVLTAGVAHELGNPLNNISMVAQNFIELFAHLPDEDKLEYMTIVLQESERIRKIVQDLLDFSKPKESDFKRVDMNALVRHCLKLVQNMFDVTCIKSSLELEENLPSVYIDENKIEEVLVNLMTNAVHAMSCGGNICIRTRQDEPGDYIVIEVQDSGEGIAPEFLSQIFDPFFSTKGTEGTGLGLSISYSIIKTHKGKIDVRSRLGEGTTFEIKLPIRKEEEISNGRLQDHGN
jgi:two-component system, NtrC family, sensor kinase